MKVGCPLAESICYAVDAVGETAMEVEFVGVKRAVGVESCRVEKGRVVGWIPRHRDGGGEVVAVYEEPAIVVDAGVVRTNDLIAPEGTEGGGGSTEECGGGGRIVFARKKSEEPRAVGVKFVVRSVQDCRDAADRFPVSPGKKSLNTTVEGERTFRREVFGDATRERGYERRIRSVQPLR